MQNVGAAIVKLELSDRVVEAEVTPIQASIAELFESRETCTIAELSEILQIPDQAQIRNALAFWAGLGVVKEDITSLQWRLLEYVEDASAPQSKFSQRITIVPRQVESA